MSLLDVVTGIQGSPKVPEPVKIRIPRDHPAAPMLKHLFATLATEERTKSGIYIKKQGPSNRGVRQFLEALRDVLSAEGIDLDRLAADVLNFKHPQPLEGIMDNPLMLSQLFIGAFGGPLGGGSNPKVRERYLNRAEALMKKVCETDST
jgi:hypothetical protein